MPGEGNPCPLHETDKIKEGFVIFCRIARFKRFIDGLGLSDEHGLVEKPSGRGLESLQVLISEFSHTL